FDHRWFTYSAQAEVDRSDTTAVVQPRYWVSRASAIDKVPDWTEDWMLAWRDITNATNERTVIFSVVPAAALSHTAPLAVVDVEQPIPCLVANLSSFVLDYAARQ